MPASFCTNPTCYGHPVRGWRCDMKQTPDNLYEIDPKTGDTRTNETARAALKLPAPKPQMIFRGPGKLPKISK